jgi:hypothetical protein
LSLGILCGEDGQEGRQFRFMIIVGVRIAARGTSSAQFHAPWPRENGVHAFETKLSKCIDFYIDVSIQFDRQYFEKL